MPKPRRRNRLQRELYLEDVTGQAHSTDRRAKKVGVLLAGALDDSTVGDAHFERANVVTEVTIPVLVLSMHVGGYHASERDELGSRRYRGEPAPGHEQAIELAKRKPRLGAKDAGIRIEREDAVCIRGVQHFR